MESTYGSGFYVERVSWLLRYPEEQHIWEEGCNLE